MSVVPSPPQNPDIPAKLISGIFWTILGFAYLLAICILFLPSETFLVISNYIQIITAIGGALVFIFAYYRYGRHISLIYAAGTFGLWGVSNIAWYVNIILGKRNEIFPGPIDIGMIAAICILTIAYQHAFPLKKVNGFFLLAVLGIMFLVPIAIILTAGISYQTLMTFLYFLACGSLLIIGLLRSLPEHPLILTGTILFAASFMIYPVRETFFLSNGFLNLIGVFVFAGFALIVLGIVPVSQKSGLQVIPSTSPQ